MGGPGREEEPEILVPDDDHGFVVRDERAARRRQRRQTWTFLVAFMLVLGTGVGALTHYQGVWTWPSGDPAPAAPTAATCTDVSELLPAKSITLQVYNASDKAGLAGRVGTYFSQRGFRVAETGNDPQEAKVTTVALLRYGPDGALAARTVGAHIRGAITRVQDERIGDTVDLVLSGKFAMRTTDDAARVLGQVAKSLGACGAKPSPTGTPSPTRPAKPKPSTTPTTAATR